ncbi:MAG: Arylsulfatase precursor [Verrucomicrobiota bacterium]|jgi:arylsulfatase A-like enzyme
MKNLNRALALLVIALGLPIAAAEKNAVTPKRPNVVVIMVDDLGSGDVSCLFRNVVKTPNIDRLAKTGVKFTSGYVTAPLCAPSRAGLFSGVYQQRYGFIDNSGGIPSNTKLFPGALRDAGYHTGLIGKWHSKGPMPFERGCFDETLCSPTSVPFIDYHHPKLARNGTLEMSDEYSTDLFAREAEEFIERNKDKPFSLTVTFNAPHILKVVSPAFTFIKPYEEALAAGTVFKVPFVPMSRPGEAEKYADQFPGDPLRADVVATIVALDQAVGRILDKLKQVGVDQDTIVFFTGDNGGHPENRSENTPLRDYKWTLYEGGIRVPFFAVYPAVFPAGLEFKHPVSTLDIFPTLAALTGAKTPADLDGINLTPYLTGEMDHPPHDELYFGIKSWGNIYQGAMRQGDWKLVLTDGANQQLYNLSNDVGEKNNLASVETERVTELTKKWKAWQTRIPPPPGKVKAKRRAKIKAPE